MKTLWSIYYRLKLKSEYNSAVAKAKVTTNIITGSTLGRKSHFYDANGTLIRGWAEKTYQFSNVHPLIAKYN